MKIGFNPDFDDSIKSLTLYVGEAMEVQKAMWMDEMSKWKNE